MQYNIINIDTRFNDYSKCIGGTFLAVFCIMMQFIVSVSTVEPESLVEEGKTDGQVIQSWFLQR